MIIDTFSKRQKRMTQQAADVFSYDTVSKRLRIQVIHIWDQALGIARDDYGSENPAFRSLSKNLSAEFGVMSLGSEHDKESFAEFFLGGADTDQALDMIETSFRVIYYNQEKSSWKKLYEVVLSAEEAIEDLNERFLENGLGYAFIEGDDPQLIRKDNEHLHQESVLPALHLLHEQGFQSANDEYRSAHEHYRHGKIKECLNDCLKAFESTLKTICQKRSWTYRTTDTAKTLIKTCLDSDLLPGFAESHLIALRTNLEGTIPTVRNKLGGHGQGETPVAVPKFYAEFMLHDTAATIVFLVEAFKALP